VSQPETAAIASVADARGDASIRRAKPVGPELFTVRVLALDDAVACTGSKFISLEGDGSGLVARVGQEAEEGATRLEPLRAAVVANKEGGL